ncbi:LutC/YkgG family protein [Coralloluteibacterium stylophorae]|uniref:Lactate utilization protein n=1 Tax=Coralloluteibacterium stylophorae TaxID=1776034 RepID=A0A8J8B149_9GAMM|nr:lactate utilization protein [Coralloluteibacterium stylophorae]MBS7458882.1 lactate utilization protein [Coralloluteibacterium stylophorae]
MSRDLAAHGRRARAAIFDRLGDATPPVPKPAPALAPWYAAQAAAHTGTDRVARFVAAATAWHAQVVETTPTAWADAVADLVAEHGIRNPMAGPDTAIAAALDARLARTAARLHWYARDLETDKDLLFDTVDCGVTTARGGIAETGSLVLWPDAREPRTLSLVPPMHIAVLHADALVDTLHEAMTGQRWADALPTNALLVTGPSKTADIQRLLVYGAHGPKRLAIVLIRNDPS